jgi:ornithine carbamoyltransferase
VARSVSLCERTVNGWPRLTPRKPAAVRLRKLARPARSPMPTALNPRLQSPAAPTADDLSRLRATAALLAQALPAGATPARLLAGKHVAVVWADDPREPASPYAEAATALGARVSHLHLDEGALQADPGTAQLLARLYDAVACDALDAPGAARLQRRLGIPVYGGAGRADHPLAPLWAGGSEAERARLLQALLLSTIA